MKKLIIDADLQDHLPQVSTEEDSELERQLVATGGPTEPIRVWKGKDVIIDGHRRYGICQRLGLPFTIKEMEFTTIQEVKDWMDSWQGARRNLNTMQKGLLVARLVASRRSKVGGRNAEAIRQVAEESGITERTVYRSQETAAALATLPKVLQDDIRSNRMPISPGDLKELSEFAAEDQLKIHESVKIKEFSTLREAIHGEGVDPDNEPLNLPKSPTTKPTKPFGVLSVEAEKALGALLRTLDNLRPHDQVSYKTAYGYVEDLEKVLKSWKKPAKAA